MNMKELALFVNKNLKTIETILDLYTDNDMNPADGEKICLYIAGLSAGMRGATITGDWSEIIARAWQLGASEGYDPI